MNALKFGKLITLRNEGNVRVCEYVPNETWRISSIVRVQTAGPKDNSPAYLGAASAACQYCSGGKDHTVKVHKKESKDHEKP